MILANDTKGFNMIYTCALQEYFTKVVNKQTHTRDHTHTHSVGIIWTSERPVAETKKQHSQETDIRALTGSEPATPGSKWP